MRRLRKGSQFDKRRERRGKLRKMSECMKVRSGVISSGMCYIMSKNNISWMKTMLSVRSCPDFS